MNPGTSYLLSGFSEKQVKKTPRKQRLSYTSDIKISDFYVPLPRNEEITSIIYKRYARENAGLNSKNIMGLQFKMRKSTTEERTLQLNFEEYADTQPEIIRQTFMPAEWHPQSGVQLTWPHSNTDWAPILPQVTDCYVRMAYEIISHELLLIVTPEREKVEALLKEKLPSQLLYRIRWMECPTNDTWARDHGFITLLNTSTPLLLDFCFNGWGMKFAADKDNQINRQLHQQNTLNGQYVNCLDFVFEGGSIESDGKGTLMTTSACLLSPNRNDHLDKEQIEKKLKATLHAERVLWLDHGYLAGDDTDSHIDTLARFCPDRKSVV